MMKISMRPYVHIAVMTERTALVILTLTQKENQNLKINTETQVYSSETLAICLLDIVGSTQFVQQVGALRAAEWLQYHDRLTRTLLYKFNGREIDRSDGFMLSFKTTIDAVNFALYYQMTIPIKTKLQSRIGIHWGEVVEVQQAESYILANAKRIELEGVSKNIAARTMSVCSPGQVLITKEAFQTIKNKTNYYTPKGTRYACLGLYKFKGVREPQALYGVGLHIDTLQPPPSSEKAQRLGGAKKIKSHHRDKRLIEWVRFLLPRLALISAIYILATFWPFLSNKSARELWGLKGFTWVDWINYIYEVIKRIILGVPL